MNDSLTKLIPSRLGAALAVALLAGAAAPGPAPAQPRPADLELDLFYLIRDLQGLEEAGGEGRAAFAEELAVLEDRLEAAPEADGRLWAGLDWLYRQLERAEEADDAWRRARSAGHPGPRPDTAADLFRPPGERKPGVVGRVSVGAASDSNPSRLGEDLTLPAGLTVPAGLLNGEQVLQEDRVFPVRVNDAAIPADQEDSLVLGSLRLGFHPWFDRGGWSAGVEVEGHGALNQDLDPLDRTEGRATVHLALGGDPAGFLTGPLGSTRVPRDNGRFGLLLQAGAARNLLDGESHVTAVEGTGALLFRGGRYATTRIEVRRSELELEQDLTDLTGAPLAGFSWDETAAGLVQAFFLGRQDRVLRLGASAGERRGAPEVEGSFLEGHARLDLVLAGRWALFLGVEVRQDDYDRPRSNPFFPSVFFGEDDTPTAFGEGERPPRDETSWRTSALLVRELPAGLRLIASVTHEDRDAEVPVPILDFDPLSYDRTAASLGLGWRFGREGTP